MTGHVPLTHMTNFVIREDDLSGQAIQELLLMHLALMRSTSPPESVHALDLTGLRAPDVTVWTLWQDKDLLACGALKMLTAQHGEIKSMHTSAKQRRSGVATRMLKHILSEATRRGITQLSLETGSMHAFAAARQLYEKHGFSYCEPFGDYRADPNSVFMTCFIANDQSDKP